MDETIGVKGGANDRRRMMLINKKQKMKLKQYEEDQEISELEKKVRKKQIFTLIKTLPIAIGGSAIQVIHDTATGKNRDFKEEANSRWKIKEYDQDITHLTPAEFEERKRKTITTPSGQKIVVYIETPLDDKKVSTPNTIEDSVQQPTFIFDKQQGAKEAPKTNNVAENKTYSETTTKEKKTTKPTIGIGAEQIDIENFIDQELEKVDFANLSPAAQETLGKLKSRKIVEEYEKRLKDIRYELRQVVYEYNTLSDESERIVLSQEAEIILDRLSKIIDKIEELKSRIQVDHLNQYDDNYVYYLIEGYLKEFRDKKVVSEIEDSPLYILIEEKLEELENKRGNLSKKVDGKKEKLEEKEISFEEIKRRYDSIRQFNNQLLEFQYEQSHLLKEIQEKVANALTETEKVREEFTGLTGQSRRLLRMLSRQMLFPGLRGAKRASAAAAAYLYFMKNVINPNTRTVRYKVITVKDYHDDIQDSIDSIDDAIRMLGKTSNQIDKMIEEIKIKFKDYIGVIPECDELLINLNRVKKELSEKEYEIKRIKEQQENELEKNDAKVKKMGEYPVN